MRRVTFQSGDSASEPGALTGEGQVCAMGIPPESGRAIGPKAAFAALGSHNRPSAADSDVHPTMHRTDSIDHLVVLSGEMGMVMEEGVVRLRPGDRIVQRGTNHAWRNTGPEPCRLAAVLIDAAPIAANQQTWGGEQQ